MKTKAVTEYMCEICEETFQLASRAEDCEKVHEHLAKVNKIGAKVKWSESCVDYYVSVYGTVVGFAENGLVIELERKYPKCKNTKILSATKVSPDEKSRKD